MRKKCPTDLAPFRAEIAAELDQIIHFWMKNSVDRKHGGFVGKMDAQGLVHPEAEKGCVLNSRILWTFSAALLSYRSDFATSSHKNGHAWADLRLMAERAYQYLATHFRDLKHGGVYWSVDYEGNPLNTRKQIYALAFAIYGLTEFYRATQRAQALEWAVELFDLIEKHSFDPQSEGYLEAFSEDWQPLSDLRLSEKDRNDPFTTNTHLHLIEAYANLYRVYKNAELAERIKHLLHLFEDRIIDSSTSHMRLFFDSTWESQSANISFGHDIEAAWLLFDAAKVLGEQPLVEKWKKIAVRMAQATNAGLNPDGSLNHEYDFTSKHTDSHREWWVSAEGIVGYFNAYEISQRSEYAETALQLWNFTKKHLVDTQRGEWHWGVYADYSPMNKEDKIGFWKCPYHNARACMQVLKRL